MEKTVKMQDNSATDESVAGFFNGCLFRGPSGSTGYFMTKAYKEIADDVLNLAVRPDDVWVTGFPRSGTTLTQELVWLVATECDYETASKIPLMSRYMFLEGQVSVNFMKTKLKGEISEAVFTLDDINSAPSPRFIKTHTAFSLLPSNLLDTTKVVYIARDPRDVAVSNYQYSRKLFKYTGDFKTFWNIFVSDLHIFCPILAHVKEAWELRRHHNMMFIFYEDLLKDIPLYIKRVADFLNKKLTDDQITKLTEHLNIKNFRKNESVNPTWIDKSGDPNAEGFIRKGGAGGWRQYFDEEMTVQAQRWMRDHLTGSNLRFPEHTS
ncbi:luciferin sulfotransferase-like [Leguminivora glycinivorella]|uniref:luciferin sulfotransferase-like n=1 Tax=Leguminivora glycinivorella TaxID=1035111 RepID=UPI00201016A0|nr:luciferin sulfotransferase-like [Leguminivora glycinivorella]